jgi:hypothetical protein
MKPPRACGWVKIAAGRRIFLLGGPLRLYKYLHYFFIFLKARLCGVARNEVASKKASSMFYLIHSYLITN